MRAHGGGLGAPLEEALSAEGVAGPWGKAVSRNSSECQRAACRRRVAARTVEEARAEEALCGSTRDWPSG